MTVNEFDNLARGPVDYCIFQNDHVVSLFTRDIMQDEDAYRRNLVKMDKYLDAEIIDIFSMGDIIRVKAKAKPTDSPV